MMEVEQSSFADFRALSERGRMEIREAAFSLHCERVRNSHGLIFGDAHYSFPRRRLGRIEDATSSMVSVSSNRLLGYFCGNRA
jgi:hypothetical protein